MRANKSLGQNFLKDEGVALQIAEAAVPGPDFEVIEIGPGLGSLTEFLAGRAKYVTAVEIDSRLVPILRERLSRFENVTIIEGDFLKTDVTALRRNCDVPLSLAGNLPYYITTPILMKILEDNIPAEFITVMLQKEVADKIEAGPSEPNYGVLAVILQHYFYIERIADVPAESFEPKPKVDSAVIRLRPRREADLAGREKYCALVKASFNSRRKTLPNSLSGYLGRNKEQWAKLLSSAQIDPLLRAEALSHDDFDRILCLLQ